MLKSGQYSTKTASTPAYNQIYAANFLLESPELRAYLKKIFALNRYLCCRPHQYSVEILFLIDENLYGIKITSTMKIILIIMKQ